MMNALRPTSIVVLFLIVTVLAGCATSPSPEQLGLPNPAAVYCQEQGYKYDIRTDAAGNQYGVCVFTEDWECDAWAYYRGECSAEGASIDAGEPLNLVESAGLDETDKIEIWSLDAGPETDSHYSLNQSITDEETITQIISALDVELELTPNTFCVPDIIILFFTGDGPVQELDFSCQDALFLRGEQTFWRGRDYLPPEAFVTKIQELVLDSTAASVEPAGTVNVVAMSRLDTTERIDILAPTPFSGDVGESKKPTDLYTLLLSITDPDEILTLIASLDVELQLEPRERCVTYYILEFYLTDGGMESYGYGCELGQGDFLRGDPRFWSENDLKTPDAFDELMATYFASVPQHGIIDTGASIELPPRDDLPKVGRNWKRYLNDIFGYGIKMPPKADFTGFSVDVVPADEIPEGMSADQYYTRLQKKYRKKLCVQIDYNNGYIAISAAPNTGEKYTTCGRADTVEPGQVETVELVEVGNAVYQARGYSPGVDEGRLSEVSEIFWIEFEDGMVIEYGSQPNSEGDFSNYISKTKPMLLAILSTFETF